MKHEKSKIKLRKIRKYAECFATPKYFLHEENLVQINLKSRNYVILYFSLLLYFYNLFT